MKEYIYGINPIKSAWDSGLKFYEVFLKEEELENKKKKWEDKGIKVTSMRKLNFDDAKIPHGINTQGIIAQVHKKQLLSIDELIFRAKKTDNPVLILADKITDPHNIGAILRNISAFNAQGLIIGKNHISPINSTVHKTSAGNSFYVDVAQITSMTQNIKKLKEEGFWIVDTRMDGKMSIESLENYGEPLVIVLGSEGSGVSQNITKQADMSLSIKMNGKAESLNVAATSAIVLHALQK